MDDNQISGTNSKISVGILAGETVNSLLNGWVTDLPIEDKADLQNKINSFAELVKKVSPQDVENKNINQEIVTSFSVMLSPFKENLKIRDSFFNTLNLCVVGLGTRLKSINND